MPRQNKEKLPLLSYEELGLTPIRDFDYQNYDKVTFNLFRIGVDTVDLDIQATSLKDLGVPRHFAQFTTSAGSRTELLT